MKKELLAQEYRKQRQRVQAFIRQAEKRGYIFPQNIVPNIPKNITQASINRLDKLRPQNLYAKASYSGNLAFDIIHALQARELEIKARTEKAQQTKRQNQARTQYRTEDIPRQDYTIIENIRAEIVNWSPAPNWSNYHETSKQNDLYRFEQLFESEITNQGMSQVARNLQNNVALLDKLVESILYSSDREQVEVDFVTFTTIIKGRALTLAESQNITKTSEYYETL